MLTTRKWTNRKVADMLQYMRNNIFCQMTAEHVESEVVLCDEMGEWLATQPPSKMNSTLLTEASRMRDKLETYR